LCLDWYLELDVEVSLAGDSHDVRELAGKSCCLIEVVDREDLEAGGANHHLGLVNVCPPLVQVGRLVRTKLYLNLSILGNLNDRAEFTDQSGRFLEI